MKKLIALLLLAVLLCSCVSAFAEDDGTYFDVGLLKIFEYDADEWMNTSFNKALFAVCAMLDYGVQESAAYPLTNLYSGTVYVGRAENVLVTAYNDPDRSDSIFILYDVTVPETALYGILNIDAAVMASTLSQTCTDGYYKVEAEDLSTVVDIIQEALNSD